MSRQTNGSNASRLSNDQTPIDAWKKTLRKWKNSLLVPKVTRWRS